MWQRFAGWVKGGVECRCSGQAQWFLSFILLGAEAPDHSDKLHGDPHRAEFEEHVLLKGTARSMGDLEGLLAAHLERPQGASVSSAMGSRAEVTLFSPPAAAAPTTCSRSWKHLAVSDNTGARSCSFMQDQRVGLFTS